MNNRIENIVNEEYKKTIGIGDFQLPLFFDSPIHIGDDVIAKLKSQHGLIDKFFKIVSELGQKVLKEDDINLKKMIFSDSLVGMTIEYHKGLPECCWKSPVMYRTDQAFSGKIYEIQAPGSGWGDIPLLAKIFQQLDYSVPEHYIKYAEVYASNIASVTGKITPKVYHMIDASSSPVGIRYLWAITSDRLKYWGLCNSITMDSVDYVTAHSAATLTTSNYFRKYLDAAVKGNTIFGIPPNLLFDQKVIYLLPFYRATRALFPDEIRQLFPFTTIIENNGYYDENGQFVSIDVFVKRPPRERQYYLKYGGPDIGRNWGSRAVYRLSGHDCERRLDIANELSQNGEIWLLQKDVSKESIQNASGDIDAIVKRKLHIKLSAFNGINGQLGVKIMARQHFKVHGQRNTYIGLAI